MTRWTSEASRTLSYVPVLPHAISDFAPVGLWSNKSGGPLQLVYLERTPFTLDDMAEAMTGLRLSDPISPATISPQDLVRHASELVKGNQSDRNTAMTLVELARKRGYVDADSITVAAASFGSLLKTELEFGDFWASVDEADQHKLLDAVLERLGNPAYAASRFYCADSMYVPHDLMMRARSDKLVAIIRSRSGLALWQYQCAMALVIHAALASGFDDDNFKKVQHDTFIDIADDQSSAFFLKAEAFCHHFTRRRREEEELFSTRYNGGFGEFARICGVTSNRGRSSPLRDK